MDANRREKTRMLVRILEPIGGGSPPGFFGGRGYAFERICTFERNRGGPNFRRSAALSSHSSHRSLRCPLSHETRCRR